MWNSREQAIIYNMGWNVAWWLYVERTNEQNNPVEEAFYLRTYP